MKNNICEYDEYKKAIPENNIVGNHGLQMTGKVHKMYLSNDSTLQFTYLQLWFLLHYGPITLHYM